MRRDLFEVDEFTITATGGHSVLKLLNAVRPYIKAANQRFGIKEEEWGDYDLPLLAFNVASVNYDVAMGSIARPITVTELARAVAREYEANLIACADLCNEQLGE